MGTKMKAANVISLRVYGDEDALVMVRLQAGLRLETISRGKRPQK